MLGSSIILFDRTPRYMFLHCPPPPPPPPPPTHPMDILDLNALGVGKSQVELTLSGPFLGINNLFFNEMSGNCLLHFFFGIETQIKNFFVFLKYQTEKVTSEKLTKLYENGKNNNNNKCNKLQTIYCTGASNLCRKLYLKLFFTYFLHIFNLTKTCESAVPDWLTKNTCRYMLSALFYSKMWNLL